MSSLTVGGSEIKACKLANFLQDAGWRVEIAYLNAPDDLLTAISSSIQTTCFKRRFSLDVGTSIRLKKLLRAESPTIVVSVNVFPLVYLTLSRIFGRQGVYRTIALVNNMAFAMGTAGQFRKIFYARVLGKLTGLVFGSEFQKRYWEQVYGVRGANSTVIYNGVDTDWFSPAAVSESRSSIRNSLGIGHNNFVFVTVARLHRVKNHSLLINAVKAMHTEFPQIMAIIVGDGPERTRLEQYTKELEIDGHVRFVGSTRDVRPMLLAADLFILTSDSENFSNAALEAMSMGIGAILPNIGGCPEMVIEGVNGWLFSKGSIANLNECIREAVSDTERCRRMGMAARQNVVGRFPVGDMLRKYERFIFEASLPR